MTEASDHPQAERRSPLDAEHDRLGATMTSFAGWRMPLRYRSDLAEHRAVRTSAGLFDLSHMGRLVVDGAEASLALDYALTGFPSAIALMRARYMMLCSDNGGILDDLIVYRLLPTQYLVVANAANTALVRSELAARAAAVAPNTTVSDKTAQTAMIALQGPRAAEVLSEHVDPELIATLRYYGMVDVMLANTRVHIARTGYTGEDGFELFAPATVATTLWTLLLGEGRAGTMSADDETAAADAVPARVLPAGLSSRDLLRLEAGMPLYGHELTPDITPYDAGLGSVVRLDKPGDFVGRRALEVASGTPPRRRLAGMAGMGRRPARAGCPVVDAAGTRVGTVTSGAPSPTVGRPIALAYLDANVFDAERATLAVDVRGRQEPFELVPLPFYSRPKGRASATAETP